jgi:hypothetical protein
MQGFAHREEARIRQGHRAVVTAQPEERPKRLPDLLELQRLVGNSAVANLMLQRDTPTGTLPADAPVRQAPPAAVPDKSKALPPPAPTPVEDSEGPHPGVDIGADAKQVTISLVYRDFNFPKSEDAVVEWLHEPNISIQVSPGTSQAVVQAAIAAINAHLKRHAKDIVEFSVSPQVAVPTDDPGGTSVGIQGQAEFHVTATFSITASSTVSGARKKETGRFDLSWDPFTIGVLYHLESEKKKEAPHRADQADDTIGLIESMFDASMLDDGGKEDNLKDAEDYVIARMIGGMSEAKGKDVARVDIDLGPRTRPLPARMEDALAKLMSLIKFSHPELESVTHVQVSFWRQATGSKQSTLMMFFDVVPKPDAGVPGDYPVPKKGSGRPA